MNGAEFVLSLAAMGLFSGLVYSVIRTIGRYLERRQSVGGRELAQLRAEVEALRTDLAEYLDSRQRLQDLEERVDFAERLLARDRDRALPKGD
jgi:uncharacterized protein involved in exopolysaccharide biosynthesis